MDIASRTKVALAAEPCQWIRNATLLLFVVILLTDLRSNYLDEDNTSVTSKLKGRSNYADIFPKDCYPFTPPKSGPEGASSMLEEHRLDENVIGPLQRSEAIMLYALVAVLRPQKILEYGFNRGHSARAMLSACAPECLLTSVDIAPWPGYESRAEFLTSMFPANLIYHGGRSQETFVPEETFDLIFIDAAHDLNLNKATWKQIVDAKAMASNCVIVVHDTGLWEVDYMYQIVGREIEFGRRAISNKFPRGGRAHQPDEIEFVNWILQQHPTFTKVDLVSNHYFRHGMTFLQEKMTVEYVDNYPT